jgi:small subunit ribosomal protein S1
MSSTENSSSPEAASPEREPQVSAAKSGESHAAPPPETQRVTHPDTILAPPPAAATEAHGGDDGGGDDDAPEHAADAAGGDGAPGEAGAPRKRRRRRRKKGGAQAGAPGATPGGEGEAAAAGEEGATAGGQAEGPAADRPKVDRPARPKKHERRERPQDRLPRERPAFGVGDVVFGKIIEITDDAVFVDLSGKARGIFDRHEMLLPDEPAEDPAASRADLHDEHDDHDDEHEEADDEASANAPSEGGEPAVDAGSAEGSGNDATVEAGAAIAADGSADEPPAGEATSTDAHDGERRLAGRRIIVAAGVKAVEAAQAQPSEPAQAPKDTPDASAAPEGADVPATASDAAVPAIEASAAPPAPRPAPYAPPIVLELGAHFVGLVHNDGSRGGLIVLTRHPRRIRASKLATSAAFREQKLISGLVTGVVRGGVEVDVDGLRAFAPGSHLDLRPGADLRPLVGRRLEFLVTQYGKRGRDVVLSRRPMLESEAKATRAEALERVQVGAIVSGTVKSVVSFGAFLDIGGVEGLVTLQEMSHNRSDAPHDVFRAGETIDVRIIRMDEKGKIWLSRKSAIPDPWDDALKKYAVGTRHTGKVVRLQPFGAFVELESGIDGLIHIGDLSMKPIEHPSEVVKVGDTIEVVVAQADQVSHKIGLHPAPTGAAADEAPQRIQMRKPVKVQVTAVEPGGLVVRVLGATGRQARGYITSMATGTPRGTELRKPFPVGMILDAQVIEIDPRRGEIKLSIKALHEDTERNAYQQYRQQVTREAKFGTFGDLLAKKDAGK